MSEAMYDKMCERWNDFLDAQNHLEAPGDEEHLSDMYFDLSHKFCKKYRYSTKTEEFAFHGRWWDTFADMYYQKLEEHGWGGFEEYPRGKVNG